MSPEIVIEDAVGQVIKKVTFPDSVNSACEVEGIVAEVTKPGLVIVAAGLITGAQEVLSRKYVDGGVLVNFAAGQNRVDLRRVSSEGEVNFVSIVARPSEATNR